MPILPDPTGDPEFVHCPVCTCGHTEVFAHRKNVPVHQNLIMASKDAAERIARAELLMRACTDCGFVFNAAFDLDKLSYGESYDNNQACSPAFQTYLEELVRRLVDTLQVRGKTIIDVGCGNGAFLRRLVHDAALQNRGYGFDPAYVGSEIDCEGRAVFARRYYGPECADIRADVVISRHVIEHVPDPVALLKTVRLALVGSPHARVYFETPDVTWILKNRVIWDLFYEHCSLFTPDSLVTAFEQAGFQVTEVRRTFGEQYLWIEAALADRPVTPRRCPEDIIALARDFCAENERLLAAWDNKICHAATLGKVALWGAGAKGTTFANLIDPIRERIDCIVDLNPKKQNRFLPGTGHPIVDFRELPDRGVRTAILMNPNYLEESRRLIAEAGLELKLIG